MTNDAVQAAGALREKFASSAGHYLGYVAVAFCAALVVVIVLEDAGYKAACAVVAVALISWVALIRPAASLRANGVLLQNMLRDSFVPSSKIVSCAVAPMLVVTTQDRRFQSVGVSRSAVSQIRERSPGRRGSLLPGTKRLEAEPPKYAEVATGGSYTDYVVSQILKAKSDASEDDREPVVVIVWPAVAAVVAALILVVAVFV